MKLFSAALTNHYQQGVTQLAEGWRVTRTDGGVFGWTTSDLDMTLETVLYRASQGLTPTSAHTTNDLSVDSLDCSVFMDVSTELEVAAGLWDEAAVVHFEYMWSDPPLTLDAESVYIKRAGTLGRIQRKNLALTAEIRGLADAFQTRIGRQYSPICPWRHAIWNGTTYVASVECQADLEDLGFIADGSATTVGADATVTFSDSANPNPDDATPNTYYEAGGQVTMTSGANVGITREVLTWTSKTFTFLRPFPYPVEVGNTYRAVRGDAHDLPTCISFYLNVVNFGGFFYVPGQDAAYATPTGDLMITPDAIVREALSWRETPYHNLASVKGIGCDCAGLVLGIAQAVGCLSWDLCLPYYSPDWHLHHTEELLIAMMEQVGFQSYACADRRPGMVLVLQYGRVASHTAILVACEPDYILHAARDHGRVVHQRLDAHLAARVRGCYAFPGVAA